MSELFDDPVAWPTSWPSSFSTRPGTVRLAAGRDEGPRYDVIMLVIDPGYAPALGSHPSPAEQS